MTMFWTVLGLVTLLDWIRRLVATIRNDGYGERTPARPDAWSARGLPSEPYRLPPF